MTERYLKTEGPTRIYTVRRTEGHGLLKIKVFNMMAPFEKRLIQKHFVLFLYY